MIKLLDSCSCLATTESIYFHEYREEMGITVHLCGPRLLSLFRQLILLGQHYLPYFPMNHRRRRRDGLMIPQLMKRIVGQLGQLLCLQRQRR